MLKRIGKYTDAFSSYQIVDFTSNFSGPGTSPKESSALGVSEFA